MLFQPLLDSKPDQSELLIDDLGTVRAALLRDTHTVKCYVADGATTEDIEHGLRDLVLPKLLALKGNLVLHGGLVAIAGASGFCLIGPSGHGKSTLTASFRTAGFDLLSDDSVSIDPTGPALVAEGLCPQPRLFPDSLAHLFSEPVASAPVVSYSTKRRVKLRDKGQTRVPVTAIFLLANSSLATGDIAVSPLPQSSACIALVANSFALDPADPSENRQRFMLAAQVAQRVPLYELSYPRDYALLPEVRAAVLRQLEDLQRELSLE